MTTDFKSALEAAGFTVTRLSGLTKREWRRCRRAQTYNDWHNVLEGKQTKQPNSKLRKATPVTSKAGTAREDKED